MNTMPRLPLLTLALALGAALVAATPPVAAAPPQAPNVAPAAPRIEGPVSLTPEAAEALRRKVLVECGLPESQRDGLPWYFHFEYGRELLTAGDARRAVVQLSQSVEMNPDPSAEQRIYGMWYIDYLPYYQLAQAHAKLGNWPCAANALKLSQVNNEAALGELDAARVRELEQSIGVHDAEVGACRKEDFLDPAFAEKTH